jgi:solute carrier family 8 (sodium/calcium exchanger)
MKVIWHGYPCFIGCLFVIGVLTAIIGDLGSHFGCTVGLRNGITAVSFVALGTNCPSNIELKQYSKYKMFYNFRI